VSKANPVLDPFFNQATRWRAEMERLRAIVLDCEELTEERKWRQPCYVFEGANVAIISSFNDYCVLAFFKGALLKDPEGILEAPGANSQSTRQAKFTSVEEIDAREGVLRSYLEEAIEAERAGLSIEFKDTDAYDVPEELEQKFEEDAEFKAAFEALTPGRQRGYLLHFGQAKQSKTRAARIENAMPRIYEGKGFNER
jgi:uncharacterized protein YdeI (YjbR/CyaY-like superfamily)